MMFNNKAIVSTMTIAAAAYTSTTSALSFRPLNPNEIDTMYVVAQGPNSVNVFRTSDINSKEWVESTVSDEVTHRFVETGRDEWSVYLDRTDKAQTGVTIQLDMHRKMALLCDNANGCRDYMKIEGTENSCTLEKSELVTKTTDGHDVKCVVAGGNTFVNTVDKNWIERGFGPQFQFKETGRDAWSVYLQRSDYESTGVSMQLDLHRNMVVYSDFSASFDYLKITTASPYDMFSLKISKFN